MDYERLLQVELELLDGKTAVSELNDAACKRVLMRLLYRHRKALQKLEHTLRREEKSITKLEILAEKSEPLPEEK